MFSLKVESLLVWRKLCSGPCNAQHQVQSISVVGWDGIGLEGVHMKNLAACSSHPAVSALNSVSSLPLFSLGIAGLEHRFPQWSSRNTQHGYCALTQS